MTTQFGYASRSSSPARKRIDAVGFAWAEKLVPYAPVATPEVVPVVNRQTRLAEAVARYKALRAELTRVRSELRAARNEIGIADDDFGPPRILISEIRRAVCRYFGVNGGDLISARRTRKIVRPRQVGMFLATKLTAHSLPEIGRSFGNRDHTTIIHARRQIERLMGIDPDMAKAVADLTSVFHPSTDSTD